MKGGTAFRVAKQERRRRPKRQPRFGSTCGVIDAYKHAHATLTDECLQPVQTFRDGEVRGSSYQARIHRISLIRFRGHTEQRRQHPYHMTSEPSPKRHCSLLEIDERDPISQRNTATPRGAETVEPPSTPRRTASM